MSDTSYTFTEDEVRQIAREEAHKALASLAGLVLRRLQEDPLSRSMDRNAAHDVVDEVFNEIFGEVLQEYGVVPGE